ncbi:uncharacterized protein LOC113273237 [Papaver somniferum]|uniref:uncharacterized protein LOC113273237 n=1 Tax=Papaver somniferum TaxID=3469 RepID=UPI000E70041C|nr:uncharacterized protein LOC113273237 [Papaver somniferum]
MEFFSRHLVVAQQNKILKGIKVAANSLAINHLLFADDFLIFTQANTTSTNKLLTLLHDFSSQSGQVINFEKSDVQFSRATMVKQVLNSLPVYQMGSFKLTDKLCKKLTTIQRKFFWGHSSNKGFNPISYSKLCKPKDFGGLAFRDMEKLNLALLTKLAWRVCTENDQLWVKLLGSKYFKYGNILHQTLEAKNCSYMWNGIIKGLQIIQKNYFMEVNNGRKTKIWIDKWINGLDHPPLLANDLHRFYQDVS